ncbi:MAG TPA: EsaB/YukD family protein [Solirubrobacteraceae bacterium]|nr:EsaB/YukD family protein [Solirubrobacteraceae bacterium]
MRTVLITLIGPERTTDLVVDADTAVTELLPSLLTAGGIGEEAQRLPGWGLAVMGKQPIQPDLTLEDSGILDGTVVVLRRDAEQRPDPVPSSPLAGGPAGSPLDRARALLAQPTAAPSLRGRIVPQIPDASAAAEGARATLEQAVGAARLTRCATVAVVSPKGGVGKTTISILLGELMCALRSETVLALDADVDYGSLGRVAPAHAGAKTSEARDSGVFDALAHGAVTFAELDRTLWSLPGGLRVVPSPRDPAQMARADRATYARVIGNLQRLAGVLVMDCGTGLGQPGVQAAILACDQLVVVTDASGATASLVVEAMRLLERTGRPMTVVCNRLRRGKQGADDLLRLDALFPRASGLIGIPDDPDAERALRGEFEWLGAPRPLHQSVLDLAAVLALSWDELGLGAAA